MRMIAVAVAALALGGCTVVSEKPLFGPQDASPHPLKPGLWALSGAGCDVGPLPPGQPLPECALPLTFDGARMDWTGAQAAQAKALGAGAAAAMPNEPGASEILLVDGDPNILQVLNGQPSAIDGKPTKPGYLALRPVSRDHKGRVDKAILWLVLCPRNGAAPGFEMAAGQCIAKTPEAVRVQARRMPPLMSYFLTWIRAEAAGGQ